MLGKADFQQFASIVLFLTGMAYTHMGVCGEIPPATVVFKRVPQPIIRRWVTVHHFGPVWMLVRTGGDV